MRALLQRGATDAFVTPITMKKGRPGVLVTVLCEAGGAAALTDLLLEESSSLGVRPPSTGASKQYHTSWCGTPAL